MTTNQYQPTPEQIKEAIALTVQFTKVNNDPELQFAFYQNLLDEYTKQNKQQNKQAMNK